MGTKMFTLLIIRAAAPLLLVGAVCQAQTLVQQPYLTPDKCLPCHQRQYDELRSSVKSGYRSQSPLMNSLEISANFLSGGLLRPVYADSTKTVNGNPLKSNNFTTPGTFTMTRQMQAGFCYSCHALHVLNVSDADPSKREVPELAGVGPDFRPDLLRPLRDYHFVDGQGKQVLPDTIGGFPPAGSRSSLAGYGVSCDTCHNIAGPDLERSVQKDGFANVSLKIGQGVEKVGPFPFPVLPKGNFHQSSTDQAKVDFIRSSAVCNSCHDVRVPIAAPGDLQHRESNNGSVDAAPGPVTPYRLENLSTEWQIGAYNSTTNPFGKVVRCQDCHMSQFPFTDNSSYSVGDMKVTSPIPGVFASNFAAVPGVATEGNFPLQKRAVVNHNFTGVDVPIMSPDELKTRLGPDYPSPYEDGVDEYGHPKSLADRRAALLNAAVRVTLDKTDKAAKLGEEMKVRVQAVSLTGHRFPAGFSQERTGYVNLTVKDGNGFLVYQSGYVVDKPHPDTGEMEPDGNLDDEDLEHVRAIVDPGKNCLNANPECANAFYAPGAGPQMNGHTNQVFDAGPDEGPDLRVYSGINKGLVLFRNELVHIYLPGQSIGRSDLDGKDIKVTKPHYEETFSAAFSNTVDNFRSLQPLQPRTFEYVIKLPTKAELAELGVTLQGPLQVSAKVNYEHFPPLFLRFLARTTSANGPAGHSMQTLTEAKIDQFIKTNKSIATADFKIELEQ